MQLAHHGLQEQNKRGELIVLELSQNINFFFIINYL